MRILRTLRGIAAASALIAALAGQTASAQTYSILVNQQSTSSDVPEGGTITFAATNVGAPNDAVITLKSHLMS